MILTYLGIYTLLLAIFWGFVIVAKIHAYKFKKLSLHIADITKIFIIFSVFLSLLGYVIILFGIGAENTRDISLPSIQIENNFDSQNVNY